MLNRELLRLHAALTHVLHMSGAAELFPKPELSDDPDNAGGGIAGYGEDFFEKVIDSDVVNLGDSLTGLLLSSSE